MTTLELFRRVSEARPEASAAWLARLLEVPMEELVQPLQLHVDARPPRDDRDDRGPRAERGPGTKFERGPIPHEQGMTRMFLSLGKTHGVMAKDIVGMMYRENLLKQLG